MQELVKGVNNVSDQFVIFCRLITADELCGDIWRCLGCFLDKKLPFISVQGGDDDFTVWLNFSFKFLY